MAGNYWLITGLIGVKALVFERLSIRRGASRSIDELFLSRCRLPASLIEFGVLCGELTIYGGLAKVLIFGGKRADEGSLDVFSNNLTSRFLIKLSPRGRPSRLTVRFCLDY